MAWTHLESAPLGGRTLDLYVDEGGVHMIRVDGLELMNGHAHASEDALGALAATLARGPAPRILLGGLGLGYTLAALLRALRGRGSVTVAEISADVIRWYERRFRPCLLSAETPNLRIVRTDVGLPIAGETPYDVIALDVDNGPQGLAADGNDRLYAAEGLRRFRERLSGDGVLLVWSAFVSAGFAAAAGAAGYAVECRPIMVAGRRDFHYLYVLARHPGGAARN
jgi:spermidine synthase